MAERDFSVLEQYNCKLYSVYRGRGAFICDTGRGLYLLREFSGNEDKLSSRGDLLAFLHGQGIEVDYYIPNKDGMIVSKDDLGNSYTLSRWFDAKECDIKSTQNLCLAMRNLALLHKALIKYTNENIQEFQIARNLVKEYDKHNKELKKIRNYLGNKRRKNDFERMAFYSCQEYLEEGVQASEILAESEYEIRYSQAIEKKELSHGMYNYHNIYFREDSCFLCGFEQACVNVSIMDIYVFMRKLMEKYNYDIKLGYLLINEYDKEKTLERGDISILGAMFSYPEKYWKILNFYFNSNKAWISARNQEKLSLVLKQNETRREFIKSLIL